jgi:hypothetical protein
MPIQKAVASRNGNIEFYRESTRSNIALRNDDIFDVPFARTSLTERKPLCRIPKTWACIQNKEMRKRVD